MRKWSLCICYFLPLVFHDWSLAEFLKASVVCTNPHLNNESREYCKAMDIVLDVSIYVLIFHNFAGPCVKFGAASDFRYGNIIA